MTHKWYIAQAYSGYEKKVAASIMEKVKLKDLDDSFDKIVVPTEEVVEVKKGKKRNAERKFFPGYILIKMIMNDETYHLVKGLPKVSGFLGHVQGKPTPVPEAEINKFYQTLKKVSPNQNLLLRLMLVNK